MKERLPGLPLLLAEAPRAALELASLSASWPWLLTAPRGDGHPVLVLPGLFATDAYTLVLRSYLRALGHHAVAWGAGRNWGRWEALDALVLPEIERLCERHGCKVSLVGASMGGLYARAAALRLPRCVRQVVSFSSAVHPGPRSTHVAPVYEAVTGESAATLAVPPAPVPCTSVFSRSEGMSDWRLDLLPPGPRRENVEVVSSHLGMGWHPAVLYVVADRLAQAEGAWQQFQRPAWARPFYPSSGEAQSHAWQEVGA